MQIRRLYQAPGSLQTQIAPLAASVGSLGPESSWTASDPVSALGYTPPLTQEWEVTRAQAGGVRDGQVVLPFQPVSFRDFMLFEQHNIDAGRGYTRRFRPVVSRAAGAYEALTGRTFPRYRPNRLWYRQPIYYMSNALTFVPSGTPISAPAYSTALDYELELGFVLRAPLRDATPAQAEEAIGAFVVVCDFTARDVQIPEMASGFGPQKAKHFTSSLSATAVQAADVLPHWRDLQGSVRINGREVARPDTCTARYSLGQVLAHASAGEQLHPGELFATGTLPGGSGMETGTWLTPGDTLVLSIEGIGVIEHPITSRPV